MTLEPDRVFPKKVRILETKQVRIIYEYYTDFNEKIILTSDEVLHLKGLSTSGIMGLDPIMQAKNMIGSTIATEEHASRFFSNGARLGGILKYPGKLTKEGIEKASDINMKHPSRITVIRLSDAIVYGTGSPATPNLS